MPKTYTVKQVADILGFSTNSIYTFLKEKRIKGVRIGKGRFRIPETELARVLHLSKKTTVEAAETNTQLFHNGDAAIVPNTGGHSHAKPIVDGYLPPNIFDWFVGLTAIAAGVSLFLFNTPVSGPEFSSLSTLLSVGRAILIAAGVGVIASSITQRMYRWHQFFHAVLFLVGSVNAFIFARAGDIDGAILYGALAVVIGLGNIVHVGGIVAIGLYLSLVAILIPTAVFFVPTDIHFATLVKYLEVPPVVFGLGLSGIGAMFLFAFWVGLWRNFWLFGFAAVLAAGASVAGAVYYANLQYWSRAFFMTVVGFFALSTPLWRSVQVNQTRREQMLFHLVFGGIGAVLVGVVIVISILQQMVWEQNKMEFFNKITAAVTTLTTTVDSVKSTMVVASANPDIVSAVTKKDLENIARFGKILYESNPSIRRIVFLDSKGDGLALYPYGTFDQPNFSFREYFVKARETRQPYVSNIYRALSDNAGRFVVVVAVPVLSSKGDFVGVMTASIDLDRLGLRLSQLAVESRGEHFSIADSSNKIIFHPQSERIGTDVPPDDLLRKAVTGEKNVVQDKLMDGTLAMIAYAPVSKLGWGVSLCASADKVFTLTSTAIFAIFGLVGALLVSAVVLLIFIRYRYTPRGGGS